MAGSSMPMRTPMMAMTTSNSINVKPRRMLRMGMLSVSRGDQSITCGVIRRRPEAGSDRDGARREPAVLPHLRAVRSTLDGRGVSEHLEDPPLRLPLDRGQPGEVVGPRPV